MVPADPGPQFCGLEILRARHYTRVEIVALPLMPRSFFNTCWYARREVRYHVASPLSQADFGLGQASVTHHTYTEIGAVETV
jgi:hypothetical protein